MATSGNPLAPDPVTILDGPDVFPPLDDGDIETLEDDYGEPPLGDEQEPEDEVPEEDPDDKPLADEDGTEIPDAAATADSDELFRQRHAEAEAQILGPN
jgi:hypothetical protein